MTKAMTPKFCYAKLKLPATDLNQGLCYDALLFNVINGCAYVCVCVLCVYRVSEKPSNRKCFNDRHFTEEIMLECIQVKTPWKVSIYRYT